MPFLRLRTYVELVTQAERGEAQALAYLHELNRLRKQNDELVRTLVGFKREGFAADPAATDDAWEGGRYVMDEAERAQMASVPRGTVVRPRERAPQDQEVDEMDRAVEAAINAEFGRL